MRLNNFETKYSLGRLLWVLGLSILACTLLIKYLFLWFPKLHSTDVALICLALLIIFLSPVIYAFVYRPIIMQFDQLKVAELKMREFALNDMLTGLYNRRGFLTFADKLMKLSDRAKRGLILIYADLDNLKQINDDHGHEAGDRALVCIADVLKETFRNSDVIGRVGGDEFAILALEAKAESLDVLHKRLNENLKRTKYNVDSIDKLTFSLGLIYYNPEKPQTIEELLRRADVLMYEEKSY
ncbi:MAG: GGDEF domain-containing protein [Candidatus Omnitrophica bacterium]|nr:GGDEF domain-containing protein [Candidatus Omnitrophota bacterium]